MHRTARGVVARELWQSSHVAVRWIPNEIGKRTSCCGGATAIVRKGEPVANVSGTTAGTQVSD
jgi:hypothetical protein